MQRVDSARLNRILTQEEIALQLLKLPIPKPSAHPLHHSRTELPYSFIIPSHAAFTIAAPSRSTPQAVYVIIGDPKTIASAERDCLESGLAVVTFKYPGLWLNRDPYEVYKRLGKQSLDTITPEIVPPLSLIPAFSPPQLQSIEWQAGLWSAATRDLACAAPEAFGLPPLLQPDLPLPPQVSSDHLLTLKLLPVQAKSILNTDAFLDQVRTARHPLIFELVWESGTAHFQLSFEVQDQTLIEGQLKSHFQKFFIQPAPSPLVFSTSQKTYYVVQAYLPKISDTIKTLNDFSISPYSELFAFVRRAQGAQFALQVLCAPIAAQAFQGLHTTLERYQRQLAAYSDRLASEHEVLAESSRDNPSEYDYDPATYRAQAHDLKGQAQQLKRSNREVIGRVSAYSDQITQRIRNLVSKSPPWLTCVRLISSDPHLLTSLRHHFFRQYETSSGHWQISDVQQMSKPDRRISRWGVVSTAELAALAHFPPIDPDIAESVSAKQSDPPALYTQPGIILGASHGSGRTQIVTLPEPVRDRHVYILGRTRSGKSTLITNMIVQDIIAGAGLCVIDPHGDLVEGLLDYIPSDRVSDTIYIDLADAGYPIPINILKTSDPANVPSLIDDVVGTFKRLVDSSTWGYRMENILRAAVATLTRAPFAVSFFDLTKLLKDPTYRESIVRQISYEPLREFWEVDFPALPKDAVQPLIQRMNRFADFPVLYAMLSNPESRLNFDEVMQQRKILLVNLSSGRIGEDNSRLIGCLLISQLQLAAMRRAHLSPERRVPFSLYADEFQNMIVAPFDKILSEAGKYRLRLVVAHQFISQLDEKTKDALLGNVGTILVLPINEKDANALRHSLGSYSVDDILNLDAAKHEALCRPTTKASDTFLFATNPPPKPHTQSNRRAVIEYSRVHYGAQKKAATPPPSPTPPSPRSASRPPSPPTVPTQAGEAPKAQQRRSEWRLDWKPSKATSKSFSTAQDRILHYLEQAQYLTTPQIIKLCYAHLNHNPASQKVSASNDLRKLLDKKLLKELPGRRPKIYHVGAYPNVSPHNLALRDLFVKIELSNLEIFRVDFSSQLGKLIPDLRVDFVADDESVLQTFWEYDTGTEPLAELVSKVQRYEEAKPIDSPCVFVFEGQARLDKARKLLTAPFCVAATLQDFATLSDPAFYFSYPDGLNTPQPLFG
jgi:protein involved in plasmid replication-relaxation/type IV secretory system conjugative DNA transfer VirD4/TraG family protein